MKRTEIKWEDFFNCYELNDKKLNVSNDAKKKMGDYKNDSDERKKMLCSFPFENNSDLYTEENYPECLPEEQYDFYKSIFDDMAFKDLEVFNGELNITNVFFANPMYFIRTCDELGMFEFNPYAGKTYSEICTTSNSTPDKFVSKNKTTTLEMSQYIKTNPGFAPFLGKGHYSAIDNGYAKINGFYYQAYISNRNGFHYYPHEGIDFISDRIKPSESIEKHNTIYSLINGIVVKLGNQGNDHYGLHMIVSDGKNKLYLLGHLFAYGKGIKTGSIITPNMIVGYVGNTGNCFTGGHKVSDLERSEGKGSHLHLSVYYTNEAKFIAKSKELAAAVDKTLKYTENDNNYISFGYKILVNPFDNEGSYNQKLWIA